jgi:sec-independent protein translocase protein TatC
MKGGQVVALPVLIVGILSMLRPLVPRRFWLFITTYTALTISMFLAGASFVFFVMMPVSLSFLLTFGQGVAVPVILLDQYLALLLSLIFWIGVAFELPVVMQILARFRVVSYARASTLRKWVIPTAFIFAALITPSLDGTLTLLVAIPMLLLYEAGLLASWLTHPEEGNYFADLPMVQKGRLLLAWVVRKPLAFIRRVERTLVKYGLGWWW